MSSFPEQPVTPREFVEDIVPALFADLDLDESERALELRLGVVLRGEDGGEWTLHFVRGELGIEPGRRSDCDLTLVSSVVDWRAALWEGRPGLVADLVDEVLRGQGERRRGPGWGHPAGGPAAMPGLADLRGLIEIVVAEQTGPPPETPARAGSAGARESGAAPGDWRVGVLLGPGPMPEVAQATIRLAAEEAEAIRAGTLHPVEALITGRLQLDGDLGLILQLQAVAMTLSMAAGGKI